MSDVDPLTKNIFIRIILLADEDGIRSTEELLDLLDTGLERPVMMDQIEHQLYPEGSYILTLRARRVNRHWPGDERAREWKERNGI